MNLGCIEPIIDNLRAFRNSSIKSALQINCIRNSLLNVVASGDEEKSHLRESCRVFHGRGQAYPGLSFVTVDLFDPVLLITYYEEPNTDWHENFVVRLISLASQLELRAMVLQRRYLPRAPSEIIWGELATTSLAYPSFAYSNGLLYQIEFIKNQNIGFFLDMAPAHQWLRERVKGKKVLNLFAYTCAFSVAAAVGGAEKVVNFDMSQRALEIGQLNHRLNNASTDKIEFHANDIFKSMGKILRKAPYDIVICDPPSYQRGSFVAEKDYQRLLKRVDQWVRPGGELLLCLNSPFLTTDFILNLMMVHAPFFKFIKRLECSPQFPEIDNERGLKMLLYQNCFEPRIYS